MKNSQREKKEEIPSIYSDTHMQQYMQKKTLEKLMRRES